MQSSSIQVYLNCGAMLRHSDDRAKPKLGRDDLMPKLPFVIAQILEHIKNWSQILAGRAARTPPAEAPKVADF